MVRLVVFLGVLFLVSFVVAVFNAMEWSSAGGGGGWSGYNRKTMAYLRVTMFMLLR